MLIVIAVMGTAAAAALPSTSRALADFRLRGDARSLHHNVGLAKMRAAARFTRERLYVDVAANQYHLEYWDKTASAWTVEGGTIALSSGVQFGFGGLTQPPPSTQNSLALAPACRDAAGDAVANSSCIVFNSRGIPIDSSGGPTGASALYLTDGVGTYGVTISATPLVRLWWTPAGSASWTHR
ncbi:MAG: Tfp pilus assembly protein FimT/FimU [Vicinamibacterales bacterium]